MFRLNALFIVICWIGSAQAVDAPTYSPKTGEIYDEVPNSAQADQSINYQYHLDNSRKGLSLYYPSSKVQGCSPKYPKEMRQAGIEGEVELRIALDKDGIPEAGAITQSSGHEELDNAALTAAVHCKYPPKTVNGEAVPVTFKRKIVFLMSQTR